MAMKRCPFCAEDIQEEAVKCKHCDSWLAPSDQSDPRPTRRLMRANSDRMLAGVCAGIGRYLGMDPTLVRLLFALLCIPTGVFPLVIAYIVMAFVVPLDEHVTG